MVKYCKYCKCRFEVEPYSTNYILFCPECNKSVEMIGEYGFGKALPVDFYMGFHKIGSLDRKDDGYILKRYKEDDFLLTGKHYDDALNESSEIIEKWLNGVNHQ